MHLGKVHNFYPLLMGRSFYPFNLGRLRDEIYTLLGWFVFIVMFLEHVPTKCPHNRSLSAFINVVGTVRLMYTVRKKNMIFFDFSLTLLKNEMIFHFFSQY